MEIMGILNITPDSFSDGGKYLDLDEAKQQVEKMINEGATIIDVGGESTRPNSVNVAEEEEIKRVIPIITMINNCFNIQISIDTYKSNVAKQAILAGATIINDVQANAYDGKMLELVAKYNVKYIAMHSRKCEEPLDDMIHLFDNILALAQNFKIENNIIFDPGIGFNKNTDQNLKILRNLNTIQAKYNNHFLLGTSRKRFIGEVNKEDIAAKRIIGTVVTSIVGYQANFNYIRVHDVLENKQALEMIEAITNE